MRIYFLLNYIIYDFKYNCINIFKNIIINLNYENIKDITIKLSVFIMNFMHLTIKDINFRKSLKLLSKFINFWSF